MAAAPLFQSPQIETLRLPRPFRNIQNSRRKILTRLAAFVGALSLKRPLLRHWSRVKIPAKPIMIRLLNWEA